MSLVSPRGFSIRAEHSICQPGRPRPQGDSQPGRSSGDGFQSTKSAGSRLNGAISTRAPACIASRVRRESWPWKTTPRSEEHTSELQSLMRISYAVFCLKKKKKYNSQRCTLKLLTYNKTHNRKKKKEK